MQKSDMVNGDLRLWVSQLMRDAQQAKPAEVPPPPGTVFDMPPLPAFDRILSFCGGGGDVLRLIEEVGGCLLYTSPSPRDKRQSRMPSSA